MNNTLRRNQVAFRCHGCGGATVGFLGGLTKVSDLLRLKCECKESALDIKKQNDGKLHLSVPCVYCRDNHGYTLSSDILLREGETKLPCPFSGIDILFVCDESKMSEALEKSASALSQVMTAFDAETVYDIQPHDAGDEGPSDPAIYDTLNFLVRDLEADGKVSCPCGRGKYDLRFTDEGAQVYCENCGCAYDFYAKSMSSAEEYLTLDSIMLK